MSIINSIFTNKQNCKFVVRSKHDKFRYLVEFIDTNYQTFAQHQDITKGLVKDKLFPSVLGIGFVGDGKFVPSKNSIATVEYGYWIRMMSRCYDEKTKLRQPAYKNVTVCKKWHNFQNFAEWCVNQKGFDIDGYALDKDILIDGNNEYSENACCFVPKSINGLFVSRNKEKNFYYRNNKFEVMLGKKFLGKCNTVEEANAIHQIGFRKKLLSLINVHKDNLAPNIHERLLNF